MHLSMYWPSICVLTARWGLGTTATLLALASWKSDLSNVRDATGARLTSRADTLLAHELGRGHEHDQADVCVDAVRD